MPIRDGREGARALLARAVRTGHGWARGWRDWGSWRGADHGRPFPGGRMTWGQGRAWVRALPVGWLVPGARRCGGLWLVWPACERQTAPAGRRDLAAEPPGGGLGHGTGCVMAPGQPPHSALADLPTQRVGDGLARPCRDDHAEVDDGLRDLPHRERAVGIQKVDAHGVPQFDATDPIRSDHGHTLIIHIDVTALSLTCRPDMETPAPEGRRGPVPNGSTWRRPCDGAGGCRFKPARPGRTSGEPPRSG